MADADRGELELLGRPGCHLCEALWPEVLAVAARWQLAARLVDIEQDPALHRTYLWRIPVVLLRGRLLAEGRVEPAPLELAVARALDRGAGDDPE
ncbi:MAG TPA: glutaredoxin family protein [Candidatus Micrarchaeia archaeon]|nr:glutaredoxin family protein [Candidatus Micrarchaeia archaeon]